MSTTLAPPPERRRRWSLGDRPWKKVLAYVILVPGAILFVAPLAWLFSASFQPVGDIFSWPPQWIPENPTLDGYKRFFGIGNAAVQARCAEGVSRWFINSAIVA